MADDNQAPTEIAPGVAAPQIVSNPSAVTSQITTTLALFGFAIGFCTTLASFFNGHDLIGAINYLQSAPAIGFLATVASGAIYVWRIVRRKLDKNRENTLVATVPASIAMTKQEVAAVASAPSPEHAQTIVAGIDMVAAATREAADGGIAIAPQPRT